MLPGNALSSTMTPETYESPDGASRSFLVDYEQGGVAINDTTLGSQYQPWRAWYDSPNVKIATEADLGSFTSINVGTGVSEISFAFDFAMRPYVAFMQSGVCKLYWYDSAIQNFTTTSFAGATTPFLTLDDKRPIADAYNDILFFYAKNGNLCCRYQRDRFQDGNEHILLSLPKPGRIINAGMTQGLRIQLKYI